MVGQSWKSCWSRRMTRECRVEMMNKSISVEWISLCGQKRMRECVSVDNWDSKVIYCIHTILIITRKRFELSAISANTEDISNDSWQCPTPWEKSKVEKKAQYILFLHLSHYLHTVVSGCEISTHWYGSGESNRDSVSMYLYSCVSLHVPTWVCAYLCLLVRDQTVIAK